MFSQIGQIFKTQPRLAEHTDTRQALQRHDPEYQRRRKGKNGADTDEESGINDTIVSVEALEIFLKNFLNTKGNQRTERNNEYNGPERRSERREILPEAQKSEDQPARPVSHDARVQSANAARAAYAYQSMAHTKDKERILLETTDQGHGGPELELDPQDVRIVHEMLKDLEILSERDIEYLKIQQADTFLESLQNAVKAALNASNSH